MRYYEAIIALNPTLADDRIDAIISRLEKRITDNGGEMQKVTKMGTRRLPFTLSKYKRLKDAFFILIEYSGIGKTTEVLMNQLRIQEGVVRHMVTLKEISAASLETEIIPKEAPANETKTEESSSVESK